MLLPVALSISIVLSITVALLPLVGPVGPKLARVASVVVVSLYEYRLVLLVGDKYDESLPNIRINTSEYQGWVI